MVSIQTFASATHAASRSYLAHPKPMNRPGPSEELLQLLENLPPDEPRSKLEPFRAIILRWRRQGRSYRRIQEILLEQCKVDVAYETLRRFVQRRERPRTAQPEAEAVTPSAPPPVPAAPANADPYAEMRERMRQFKAQPVVSPPARKKVFEVSEEDLDSTRPLKMLPPN